MCISPVRVTGRTFLTMLLCSWSLVALAQRVHHFQIRVAVPISSEQQKLVAHDLMQHDPAAELVMDAQEGVLSYKTVNQLSRFECNALFERWQMELLDFTEVGRDPILTAGWDDRPVQDDPPRYVDTGDRVRDNQRYDAFKAAWIAAHPVEYGILTAPREQQRDSSHE